MSSAIQEKRKLFIGGLSFNTTDDGLKNFFFRYGEVEKASVMREKNTGKSRGFGFVTFSSPEVAEQVVGDSSLRLDDRILKPMYATPQGQTLVGGARSQKTIGQRSQKLYIGGLSYTTTDEGFRSFFAEFGDLDDCILMRKRDTNKPRGFGFVTFSNSEGTELALANSGTELDGRTIDIKLAVPQNQMEIINQEKHMLRMGGGDAEQAKKVFVKGLDFATTNEELKQYFRRFGVISDSVVIKTRGTQKSRGFGFVTFETLDSAIHALNQESIYLLGKRLNIIRAEPKTGPDGGAAMQSAAFAPQRDTREYYPAPVTSGGFQTSEYAQRGRVDRQPSSFGANLDQFGVTSRSSLAADPYARSEARPPLYGDHYPVVPTQTTGGYESHGAPSSRYVSAAPSNEFERFSDPYVSTAGAPSSRYVDAAPSHEFERFSDRYAPTSGAPSSRYVAAAPSQEFERFSDPYAPTAAGASSQTYSRGSTGTTANRYGSGTASQSGYERAEQPAYQTAVSFNERPRYRPY